MQNYNLVYLNQNDIYDLIQNIEALNETYRMYIDYYDNDRPNNHTYGCYDDTNISLINHQFNKIDHMHRVTWRIYIFQKYIQHVITFIIFTSGLLMTGTLLFIFIRHKEMRSEQNMIVMNIAICDFIAITVLYPMQYLIYNFSFTEIMFTYRYIAILISSSSCLSILALGIQRLVLVSSSTKSYQSKRSRRWRIFIFVVSVWSPGFVWLCSLKIVIEFIAIDPVFIIEIPIVFFSCVLPIVITIINCVTSYRLRRSAKQMPGEYIPQGQAQPRYRSARVVHFLCLLYWVSHFPFVLAVLYENSSSDHEFVVKYVICTVNSLFYLNAVFNPLALTIMSRSFRSFYKKYIFQHFIITRRK